MNDDTLLTADPEVEEDTDSSADEEYDFDDLIQQTRETMEAWFEYWKQEASKLFNRKG